MLLCLSLICSLILGCDLSYKQKLYLREQNNTRWVSEYPDICLEITETGDVAQITIDNVTTELCVFFAIGGNSVRFLEKDARRIDDDGIGVVNLDKWLFIGRWQLIEDGKIVVNIINNDKGFLDKSIKKITFIREENE